MSELIVNVESQEVILKGHLEDTTDLGPYLDPFSNCQSIDFSGLYSCSFFGLYNLIKFLGQLPNAITIKEVPASSYRQMVLFLDQSPNVTVETFYIGTCHEEHRHTALIDKAMVDGLSAEFFLVRDHLALASVHDLSPMNRDVEFNARNEWCQANQAETKFWYNYSIFSQVCIEACADMQKATLTLTTEMLHQLVLQLKQVYRVVKPLDPDYAQTLDSKNLSDLMGEVIQISEEQHEEILNFAEALELSKGKLMQTVMDPSGSHKTFLACLLEVLEKINDLSALTIRIDKTGQHLGERCSQLEKFIQMFDRISSQSPLQGTELQKFRRKLKFEPLEADWDKTLEDLSTERNRLETIFARIIVTLQQFDLIKQVLEHRIHEVTQARNQLQTSGHEFDEIKGQVMDKVAAKLVTDVEKLAFSFHFPNQIKAAEGSMEAGDLMLF